MARGACVFIIVFLYGACSGKFVTSKFNAANSTVYLGHHQPRPANGGHRPAFFDWREAGMVSPVKNQLNCNACWAFSIIASIESHLKIYTKKGVTLSEQFLIDCNKMNAGCGTASVVKMFGDIVSNLGGVYKSEEYSPYSEAKHACRLAGHRQPIPVVGYKRVYPDEDEMAEYLYRHGPLVVGINSASMAKYTKGIDQPSDETCPPDELDHSVLIVGYNIYVSEDGRTAIPYWIIKNSWGSEWGDGGFYYLERGRNACGVASDISFPFVI